MSPPASPPPSQRLTGTGSSFLLVGTILFLAGAAILMDDERSILPRAPFESATKSFPTDILTVPPSAPSVADNQNTGSTDQQQQQVLLQQSNPPNANKTGYKFFIVRIPSMTTDLLTKYNETASKWYADALNEASAEMWLHRGMASLTYEQGQTMDPSEADVFLIPAYLRLRHALQPEKERVDMYKEVMKAVVNANKPHVILPTSENPVLAVNLGLRDLIRSLQKSLPDLYSLGLERNPGWQGDLEPRRIIPVPYVLRPNIAPDELDTAFLHNRTENFVFFRADRRPHAVEWAGCDRAVVRPLVGHANMDIGLTGRGEAPGSRITQSQYNHRMSTSDYCLVMCGDTPTTRALVSAMVAGCIPILVGRWWQGLCDPPCKSKAAWGWSVSEIPHLSFFNQMDWDLIPVANHSQFAEDPNATLTALFEEYPLERKNKIRDEMKRVQKWFVYGWGDPTSSNVFGEAYPHIWKSILYHVGLETTTRTPS